MTAERLSEQYVQDAFHNYLKSSLSQAKAQGLLDAEMLSSAEGDLMITGPALCLYFAALRCTTDPPSVPLPRISTSTPAQDLTLSNCPASFTSFLHIWSACVPEIQNLPPEYQRDLARIICEIDPIFDPSERNLRGLAADLRTVAIQISQRRSFQERYGEDLQVAIDSGSESMAGMKKKAHFVPPPMYDLSPTTSSQDTSNLPSSSGSTPLPPINVPAPPLATHHTPFVPPPMYDPSPTTSSQDLPSLSGSTPLPPINVPAPSPATHHTPVLHAPAPQSRSRLSPFSIFCSHKPAERPKSASSSRSSDRSHSKPRKSRRSRSASPSIEIMPETLYLPL